MHIVKISVRRLVEFILRSGDIDHTVGAVSDAEAMQEGGKVHRKLQQAAGSDYKAEVALKLTVPADDTLSIALEGRADGIITEYALPDLTPSYTVDEIKGTYTDLKHFEAPAAVHMAQACCYAYMYAKAHELAEIFVQVTYVHIETGKVKRFQELRQFEALEEWFLDVIRRYAVWARWQLQWQEKRTLSIGGVRFPFEYRKSQKMLVSGVYRTIVQGKRLFIEAPTGTGKTISTVFPAVKAMGEGLADKLFYLTAKTITRTVAEETFGLLMDRGLQFKVITLTAKEKICIFDEPKCTPKTCPRAAGHFDRVNDAVYDMICHETVFTKDKLEAYAQKHNVCPFEMQLDVSLWMDAVICDYNYVFDPNVYLKRFFGEGKENYIFLIDEAHNLVDRAREMYSAVLLKSDFAKLKKLVSPHNRRLAVKIEKCNKYMIDLMDECETSNALDSLGGFTMYLMRMMSDMELFLKGSAPEDVREAVLGLYLDARAFVNTYDLMDDKYIIYDEHLPGGDFMVKILCVDPSARLSERLERGRSAVFFSATLLPISYYKELLSTTANEDYDLYADSPFDTDQRLILTANDVSSRYTRRSAAEYEKIAAYILKIVRARNGNYLVFFPSYVFMQSVYDIFSERELSKAGNGITVYVQENGMSEEARQSFLEHFKEAASATVIGFCVLGGIFSEGIDLKADRLIGAIIVGTGLPQTGSERELLRAYFDERRGAGFDFAYLYPGMNKVLQAGGRVIRTEADKGVIALLDERFNYSQYRSLFPREWHPYEKASLNTIEQYLNKFWE